VLASVVFAFETTRQPMGLLPLLGGCASAYLVSCLMMQHSIMTEKIARRGVRVVGEYSADFLEQLIVRDVARNSVVTLSAQDPLEKVRAWMSSNGTGSSHQGFPVVDARGALVGVLTRRDLLSPTADPAQPLSALVKRPPAVAFEDSSLREAADLMVREGVGRLPVVRREAPHQPVGILTRSDLIAAHGKRLEETHTPERTLEWPRPRTA